MRDVINRFKARSRIPIVSAIAILSFVFCALRVDTAELNLITYSHAESYFIIAQAGSIQEVVYADTFRETGDREAILKRTGSVKKSQNGTLIELVALSSLITHICSYAYLRLCAYKAIDCRYLYIVSFIHDSDGMKS